MTLTVFVCFVDSVFQTKPATAIHVTPSTIGTIDSYSPINKKKTSYICFMTCELGEFSNCYCVEPKGRTTFQRYRINTLLGLILSLAFWYSSEERHFSVSPKGHLMHNLPK